MTNIEEAIRLLGSIQKEDECSKRTLKDVSEKILDANSQIGVLVEKVRLLDRGENERAILRDLYKISSTLLDATADICFS